MVDKAALSAGGENCRRDKALSMGIFSQAGIEL
jgi:hypothetical protein